MNPDRRPGTAVRDVAEPVEGGWRGNVRGRVTWYASGGLLKQADCRHDLARRTVAALECVTLDERGLHGMEQVLVDQPLDRRDLIVLMRDGQRETRQDSLAVDMHRAGAALPGSQPFLLPVKPRCSRSASSSVVRGSSVASVRIVPLTRSVTEVVSVTADGLNLAYPAWMLPAPVRVFAGVRSLRSVSSMTDFAS